MFIHPQIKLQNGRTSSSIGNRRGTTSASSLIHKVNQNYPVSSVTGVSGMLGAMLSSLRQNHRGSVKSIPYESLYAVWKRRYNLQPIALEFFDRNGGSWHLAFDGPANSEEVLAFILSMELPGSLMAKYSQHIKVAGQSIGTMGGLASIGRSKYKSLERSHRKRITKEWQMAN